MPNTKILPIPIVYDLPVNYQEGIKNYVNNFISTNKIENKYSTIWTEETTKGTSDFINFLEDKYSEKVENFIMNFPNEPLTYASNLSKSYFSTINSEIITNYFANSEKSPIVELIKFYDVLIEQEWKNLKKIF